MLVGGLHIRLDFAAIETCLLADSADGGVHVLMAMAQCDGAGVALGVAIQLHLCQFTAATGPCPRPQARCVPVAHQVADAYGVRLPDDGRYSCGHCGTVGALDGRVER